MNLILHRNSFGLAGIFGSLLGEVSMCPIAVTLEHAYGSIESGYLAKIPVGQYLCKRSMHRLEGMTQDFETFEITNVPCHTKLLFHWGNYNRDSDGCILLGEKLAPSGLEMVGIGQMITHSRATFNAFMTLQIGIDSFTLTVS